MSDQFDVIVVGAGSMGSATCWRLAQRGLRVLGLEQFDLPHGRGAHHGYSRVVRLAYYEHPHYVALLQRAYELWNDLERHTGQKLLNLIGGVYMGMPSSTMVSGCRRAAIEHDLAHEVIDHDELAVRYPAFRLPEDYVGFFEQQAGFIRPEAAVAAMADLAMRSGAELHGHEPVIDWQPDGSGIKVRTARSTYRSGRIIFCAGAWTSTMLLDLGVELTVTRQIMAWTWPKRLQAFGADFPVWSLDPAQDGSDQGLYYGFPMMSDNPGFKIALHRPGETIDPQQPVREVDEADEQELRAALQRYIPDADGPLLALRTCLYTNSPDGHFILDRHPQDDRVLLACGFSGHGFKFAPVIGEIMADLAEQGESQLPIGFLGLGRFSENN